MPTLLILLVTLPLGAAMGLLGLVRYQGLALPLAILLYLAAHRRWREGLGLGAGLMLPLLPWAAYLGYLAAHGHAVYDGAQVARALAGGGSLLVSLKLLLLRVIPGSFLAASVPAVPDDPLVALPTVPDLLAGVAFTGLAAVGLVRARGEAIAWYLAVSLLLILLWNANFVFLGYAQAHRNKYREQLLRRVLLTDTHSPNESRAQTVRNIDAWYPAFGVEPGQALYLDPKQRVRVW